MDALLDNADALERRPVAVAFTTRITHRKNAIDFVDKNLPLGMPMLIARMNKVEEKRGEGAIPVHYL